MRSDDDVKQELHSGAPSRVEAALRDLKKRVMTGTEVEIPPFSGEILDCFGSDVPEETQLDFIAVVWRYHSFVPNKSDSEKMSDLIALVLRYAVRYVAFEVAMKLKISREPAQAVALAMDEILRHGIVSQQNIDGAKYLVSRLLDGRPAVRKATLAKLREWPDQVPFREVIDWVKPQLDADEWNSLRGKSDTGNTAGK
jgi:hypothetical protein